MITGRWKVRILLLGPCASSLMVKRVLAMHGLRVRFPPSAPGMSMKKLLVLFVMLIGAAEAGEEVVGIGIGPGISRSNGTNLYYLNINDINHFDQIETTYGFTQYGSGGGGIQIGNGVGIDLNATSGMSLIGLGEREGIAPQIGFDLGGRIRLNTNSAINSFYQWLPAVTVGPQIGWGKSRLLLLAKGGASLGNYDNIGIMPNMYWSYGGGVALATEAVDISSGFMFFGDNSVVTGDVMTKCFKLKVGVRAEHWTNRVKGLEDNSVALIFKETLL